MNHELFMQRCLELAAKAEGYTYPNPLVGSVIVHENKIIGEGWHHKAGEAHAEINAINSVANKELLANSTIYVTLEPCSHYGKTPPCAMKLKEIGFKKVVVGSLDIHEKVNGKGIQILESAGIHVITGVLEKECIELNKRFFTFHNKKRPYIILKWAESYDGFMDKNFKTTPISNPISSQWVHQLRHNEHAILVGTQTALTDNPRLTVRKIYGKNPIRVLIDLDLKVPNNYNIYNNEAQTIIFNQIKNDKVNNIKFLKITKENFLKEILEKLYQENIQSIIIEGGSYTLQQFIDANIWDETFIIKATDLHLINGTKAPNFIAQPINTIPMQDNTILHFVNTTI